MVKWRNLENFPFSREENAAKDAALRIKAGNALMLWPMMGVASVLFVSEGLDPKLD